MKRDLRKSLTKAKVLAIRQGYAAGETLLSLAASYGVGKGTIQDVIEGETWRDTAPFLPRPSRDARPALLIVILRALAEEPVEIAALCDRVGATRGEAYRALYALAAAGINIEEQRGRYSASHSSIRKALGLGSGGAPLFRIRSD